MTTGRSGLASSDIVNDRGEFVDSDDDFEVRNAAENADLYLRGFCYPICIGEVLDDRYRIEHKLGHGSFSTVWMAYDMSQQKDVALEISMPGLAAEHEFCMLNDIIRMLPHSSNLLTYKHTFFLYGPNSQHRVLVFPLQGPCIRDFTSGRSISMRMAAAVQLLTALKSLHDVGIVHRDLNSGNVMYSLRSLTSCRTVTEKYTYLGRPLKMPLRLTPWKVGELVAPMKPHESIVEEKVVLGDFGLAVKINTSVDHKVQWPAMYCAPERIHGQGASFASDMWSYMCLFAELYTDTPLFYGSSHTQVVSNMRSMLGPLPISWKGHFTPGPASDEWYQQIQKSELGWDLEERVTNFRPDTSLEERKTFITLLGRVFDYTPEHRLTAAQLLDDASFKYIIEIYK